MYQRSTSRQRGNHILLSMLFFFTFWICQHALFCVFVSEQSCRTLWSLFFCSSCKGTDVLVSACFLSLNRGPLFVIDSIDTLFVYQLLFGNFSTGAEVQENQQAILSNIFLCILVTPRSVRVKSRLSVIVRGLSKSFQMVQLFAAAARLPQKEEGGPVWYAQWIRTTFSAHLDQNLHLCLEVLTDSQTHMYTQLHLHLHTHTCKHTDADIIQTRTWTQGYTPEQNWIIGVIRWELNPANVQFNKMSDVR